MDIPVSLFDYELPKELIAQTPAVPRESARLMVVDRSTGEISHQRVAEFLMQLRRGDVLVINDSKVFRARLKGILTHPDGTGANVEVFLIRPDQEAGTRWIVLGRPGKRFVPGVRITIAPDFAATVTDVRSDGTYIVDFGLTRQQVIENANKTGTVPVPPYIKHIPESNDYQTVYARTFGSVAAPTAGFHLTRNLLTRAEEKGVEIVHITLHVGLGTFMPIKTETIDTHPMHEEWVQVGKNAADRILKAKAEGRRIIAVGTTTVRTLEGVTALSGRLTPYTGFINLFIRPGFKFRIVDALLTNFHLPKSTLLVLVSAFAGRDTILRAYKQAIGMKYRFYSFGDAMFIR